MFCRAIILQFKKKLIKKNKKVIVSKVWGPVSRRVVQAQPVPDPRGRGASRRGGQGAIRGSLGNLNE